MSESIENLQEQKLTELLQLKRHEQPPEGFHDAFLKEFQQRQRSELMRRSSLELFWDRLEALLGGGSQSRFALAGAATAVVIIVGIIANSFQLGAPSGLTQQPQQVPTFQNEGASKAGAHPISFPANSTTNSGGAPIQMEKVDLWEAPTEGTLNEF